VLVVFAPLGESQMASIPSLSVGIMSATQGEYSSAQFLLDVTQGARISSSDYSTPRAPSLSVLQQGPGAIVAGWQRAVQRAADAPQLLRPGLLAGQIPGGGAYAGYSDANDLDAVLASDTHGHIAAFSLGSPRSLLARIAALSARSRLVVADLPGGEEAASDLRRLSEARRADELLIVIERPMQRRGAELLWTGVAGLRGGGGRGLSSQSTNERGLIVAVDLAPTILSHLGGLQIPPDMRGKSIATDGALQSESLTRLMARLHVIGGRRLKALAWLLLGWALLALAASPWPAARARALRAGAIGVLWAPIAVLIPAALEPSAAVEFTIIAIACLALGALSDLLLEWPRALIAPALAAVVVLTVDALAGTQLLMRSVLGPNPILGARFYGIGNELKSGLAVLVLGATAAALHPARRGHRAALAMAMAGVVLAVVEGSARIGAGVGGVILVSFGFAVATVMLLPGAVTRRRALLVMIAPVVALVALAGLDLATAHGGGHFTGSVLHARSAGDLRDLIVRRYGAAWSELKNHAMPFATALALGVGAWGLSRRQRLLAPVDGDPAWLAALCGGLAAGVVGALAEDSGPVLLVVAVFALGCVTSYLWAPPRGRASGRSPVSPRSAASRRSPQAPPGPPDPEVVRPGA
jgi:hypothetical protein